MRYIFFFEAAMSKAKKADAPITRIWKKYGTSGNIRDDFAQLIALNKKKRKKKKKREREK